MELRQLKILLLKPYNTNVIVKRNLAKLSYKTMYNEYNDEKKSPILLLHGLFGNKRNYKGVAKILMNITKRVIISVDLRNHGVSPHTATHSYKELADDVAGLLNKLKLKKSILIGHSMGGRTAMTLALMKPELVTGIIVIDISPVSNCEGLKDFRKILNAMAEVDLTINKDENTSRNKERNLIMRAKNQLRELVKDELALSAIVSNIVKKSGGQYDWQCNLKVLRENFDNILELQLGLGKYPGPTLFIGGQKSHFIPPDDLTRIRDLFPSAVLTYVDNAGHLVHAEQLKRFLELVLKFVEDLE